AMTEEYHLPCFAFAMVEDQQTLFRSVLGFSDPLNHTWASMDTLFKACSISKVFTALEIMRLYQEGLDDIDLPLTVYLPDFSIQSRFSNEDPITIRKILAHRSGLPRNGCLQPWHWDEKPHVLEKILHSLKHSYMAYPPGYRYKYSNVGFDILGHIVEKKRKSFFPDHMDAEVLGKIGMEDSTFLPASGDLGNIARGFRTGQGKLIPFDSYNNIQMASGNLHTTITDMCHFLSFLFRGGMVENGEFITEEILEMMFQPQYAWPGDPHESGLAWRTDTNRLSELVAFHHGICLGTQSLVMVLPERELGIVLFCTSSSINDSILLEFGFEILRLMVQTRYGFKPGQGKLEMLPVEEKDLPDPALFEGKYCFEGEIIHIYPESRDLKVNTSGMEMRLVSLGESKFRLSSEDQAFEKFGKLEVAFFPDDITGEGVMHISREGGYIGRADKCPLLDDPEKWKDLEGQYEAYPRFFSGFTGERKIGGAEIEIRNDILFIPSHRAVLFPLSDIELVIQ
nr:serine hydrolase domain-containing protein [Synergistales bacterium]